MCASLEVHAALEEKQDGKDDRLVETGASTTYDMYRKISDGDDLQQLEDSTDTTTTDTTETTTISTTTTPTTTVTTATLSASATAIATTINSQNAPDTTMHTKSESETARNDVGTLRSDLLAVSAKRKALSEERAMREKLSEERRAVKAAEAAEQRRALRATTSSLSAEDTAKYNKIVKEVPLVLVGNGKSVMKVKLGSVIDKFKEVGRFNYFRTRGYETNVGRKTTICFASDRKDPKLIREREGCKQFIVPIIPSPGRPRQRLVSAIRGWYRRAGLSNKLTFMPADMERVLRRQYKLNKGPSTGIQSIIFMLKKYKKIAITGFDFRGGSHTHYFERKSKKKTTHSMSGEGRIIDQLVSEGRVVRLP